MRAVVVAAMVATIALAGAGGCILGTSFDGLTTGGGVADASDATSNADAPTPILPNSDAAGDAAGPPIRFVQANATSNDGPISSLNVSFLAPVAPHDTLIVAFRFPPDMTMMSITDSLNNTFTQVDSVVGESDAGVGVNVYVYAAVDCLGGVDTITVKPMQPSEIAILAHEYANIRAFDQASHAVGTAPGIDTIKSGFITTSEPNELLFAYALSGIATLGSGFTERSNFSDDVVEDRIVTTPDKVQGIATMTDGKSWVILASTYKAR